MKRLRMAFSSSLWDRSISDATIFQILNEVRVEQALSKAALAVDDQVDLFAHRKVR
jgi:hypothetical protein